MTPPSSIDPVALDKAIAALDRSGVAGDPAVANRLARLLLVRYLLPGGDRSDADRDRSVELFEESLTAGPLSAAEAEVARLGAGLLRMLRVMPLPEGLPAQQPPSLAMLGMFTGVQPASGPEARADLDRAIAHLQAVTERPVHPELTSVAGMMLVGLRVIQMGTDPAVATAGPAELMGLLAKLTAGAADTDPLRDPASVLLGLLAVEIGDEQVPAELKRLAPDLPAGEISAFVRRQLGLAHIAAVRRTGSPDDQAEAVREFAAALDELSPADEDYPGALRQLAGAVLTDAALRGDEAGVDRAIELADRVLALPDVDPVTRGRDLFLRAMARTLRAHRDGAADALVPAVDDLRQALTDVPVEDPLSPSIVGMLGALLNDRGLAGGVLEDATAAREWSARAALIARRHEQAGISLGDTSPIIALDALGRAAAAVRHGSPEELAAATDALRSALAELPAGFPWRSRVEAALGLARLAGAIAAGDPDGVRAAADETAAAAAGTAVEPSAGPMMRALAGAALLVRGLLDGDEATLAAAGDRFDQAVGERSFGAGQRIGLFATRALARLVRHERSGRDEDLDAGIADLEEARRLIGDQPGTAVAGTVLLRLSDAYGRRADRTAGDADLCRAVRTGLAGLRARVGDVLMQADVDDALTVARGAAEESYRVARRCLDHRAPRPELAAEALELGRGLALHAATSAGRVPELLTAAGHRGLAEEWAARPYGKAAQVRGLTLDELTTLAGPVLGALGAEAPSDLRRRVLAALAGADGPDRLLAAPDPEEIGAAVREVGADALVYLGTGLLVAIRADGSVTAREVPGLSGPPTTTANAGDGTGDATDATRDATATVPWPDQGDLGALCDWAWTAAIEPLLELVAAWHVDHPARLVLVPGGPLSDVPWHAARRPGSDGQHHYACQDVVFSYAASARQLVDVAGRLPMPFAADPALLPDPTGDLEFSAQEVDLLRAHLYPGAELVPGNAREVLDRLPGADRLGASMLHLSCHGRVGRRPGDSCLELAGETLPVLDILGQAYGRRPDVPGGLVVLASCRSDLSPDLTDEALTLSTAFLAAGAVGVIGSRWAVADRSTMYLMIMLHVFLQVERLAPADALRAAQLWMLDPQRRAPDCLPELLDGINAPKELSRVAAWAAFGHHGR